MAGILLLDAGIFFIGMLINAPNNGNKKSKPAKKSVR